MPNDVVIEMMSGEFIVWRCLHGGPLTRASIDLPDPHPDVPWERLRPRNVPLLAKLTEAYGSCAVLARDGESIVGQLRFYPKAVLELSDPSGGVAFCMQQIAPNGPADDFAEAELPPIDQIADRTLRVHGLMTGSPQQEQNPYQRKGLGSRMVHALIDWARRHRWTAVEANTHTDLPSLYAVTGQAGRAFWEKLGFRVTDTCIEPWFRDNDDDPFVKTMLAEAAQQGIAPDTAKTRYTMRFDLA